MVVLATSVLTMESTAKEHVYASREGEGGES